MRIIIDTETRSRADLKEVGGYNYAKDQTTDLLCVVVYVEGQDELLCWSPFESVFDEPTPIAELFDVFANATQIWAHNAAFDRDIYNFLMGPVYNFPRVPNHKWRCSSALARVNALPASLDDATRAIDASHRKDHKGSALIRKLSIPNKDTGVFDTDPEAMRDMGLYCAADVMATAALIEACRPFTPEEAEDWQLSEEINLRGIKVDTELAKYAQNYAAEEQADIALELKRLTRGQVSSHTQHMRVKAWFLAAIKHLDAKREITKLVTVHKDGEEKISLAKDIRATLLSRDDLLPDHVLEVLQCLDDGNKSSVAKFKRMVGRASPADDRVRGAFVYAGASQTLRFASRGLQLHNMRRDCFDAEETVRLKELMRQNKPLTDTEGNALPVMDTLSKLLRPAIMPAEGHCFVVSDWSSIEARAVRWLANNDMAEKSLDIFRRGEDMYKHAAVGIYGVKYDDVTKDQRQIGKVAELALGYMGGAGAFGSMAKNYGVRLPASQIDEIVGSWRNANGGIVVFANDCERAAKRAIRNPHNSYEAGRVKYKFHPKLLGGTLVCTLPSGMNIQYPYARLEEQETSWGSNTVITAMKAAWKPKQDQTDWPRVTLWRGLLIENITQAFCGAVLREALYELTTTLPLGARIVSHVHDEIVVECKLRLADTVRSRMFDAMNTPPMWAEGLPLIAEPEIMARYGK